MRIKVYGEDIYYDSIKEMYKLSKKFDLGLIISSFNHHHRMAIQLHWNCLNYNFIQGHISKTFGTLHLVFF